MGASARDTAADGGGQAVQGLVKWFQDLTPEMVPWLRIFVSASPNLHSIYRIAHLLLPACLVSSERGYQILAGCTDAHVRSQRQIYHTP